MFIVCYGLIICIHNITKIGVTVQSDIGNLLRVKAVFGTSIY